MRVYIDSDHAGDQITRRSRTGFLVFLNNTLFYWTSKKQATIETSSFGSEFMAMEHATKYVRDNTSYKQWEFQWENVLTSMVITS